MALSDEEQAACHAEVRGFLLEEFNIKFQELYSITVATCSLHPEQVNNEIRNMLTHVARALNAKSHAEFKRQMDKAEGHIDRAKRDCLKLANLHIFTELKRDSYFAHLRDGGVVLPLLQRLLSVEQELVIARTIEVEGIDDTLTKRLTDINADLQDLRKDYASRLVTPGWNQWSLKALKLRTEIEFRSNWKGFALGIVSSLIVTYFSAYGFDLGHIAKFLHFN